jgi:MFS family permease
VSSIRKSNAIHRFDSDDPYCVEIICLTTEVAILESRIRHTREGGTVQREIEPGSRQTSLQPTVAVDEAIQLYGGGHGTVADRDTCSSRDSEDDPILADPNKTGQRSSGARWSIIAISLFATASSFLFVNGIVFLIPALQAGQGVSLEDACLLSSMPSWGMVLTLIAWGYVLDHLGERIVMTAGSALTAVAAYAAASAHSQVWMGFCLLVGGMAAASCNGAGGRLVSGWFPPHQRGLIMGIRQTAQPLGIALGALIMPTLGEHGPRLGLAFVAVACALAAVASFIGIVDPPRKSRQTATEDELSSPYRGSFVLWRIHAVGSLLMVPQTLTLTFMVVWLTSRHHWSVVAAAGLVTICQLLGALGRIAVGRWSDRVESRMQPVRGISVIAGLALFLLALSDIAGSQYGVFLMVIVSVIAMLDNGLEANAITEFAGRFWSGRALGIQNTTQRMMAAACPPLFGVLIGAAEYPAAWALCGLFPLAALPLIPGRSSHAGPAERRQQVSATCGSAPHEFAVQPPLLTRSYGFRMHFRGT